MKKMNKYIKLVCVGFLLEIIPSCSVPKVATKEIENPAPISYSNASADTTNSGFLKYQDFFADTFLIKLIDEAVVNNKEVNILLQKISMAQNEIQVRRGEYLPFLTGGAGLGVDKVGEFTRNGAVEKNLQIAEGKDFPEVLGDIQFGVNFSWELDVWKKLRNAQKVASLEYLASIEGKNFLMTNLISEIANSYFELLSYRNQLQNLEQSITLQQNILEVVRILQQGAKVNSLAVKRFEAEVTKNNSKRFILKQQIFETENVINFLLGRGPQQIETRLENILDIPAKDVHNGLPAQLLQNRPDIRKAEFEIAAANLNIQVAKANFYPSIGIKAGLGYNAFNPKYILNTPGSLLFSVAGDLVAPLINKNAINATYKNASASQIQTVYEYEQTVLKSYYEVYNQLSNIQNLDQNYQYKLEQVRILNESIEVANQLFQSARADYLEVLLTQREALEARLELIETKKERLSADVNLYKSLGGGWR